MLAGRRGEIPMIWKRVFEIPRLLGRYQREAAETIGAFLRKILETTSLNMKEDLT